MKTLVKTLQGGSVNGKKILVIAGVHGDEITPVFTLAYMLKNNSFNSVLGGVNSITVINGLNMSGLKSGKREMSSNNTQDLNRILSNDSEGSCVDLLREHIDKNDVIIDIHASPACAEFALVDIDEYTTSIKSWCDKSDVRCAFRYSGANTIKRYCLENKQHAVTLEINKMNTIDYDSAKRCVNMIERLIRNASGGVIANHILPSVKEVVEIKTYQTGLISFYRNNGDDFSIGDVLYSVYDFEYNLINEVKAEIDGWVVCEPNSNFATRGDTLFLIQPL